LTSRPGHALPATPLVAELAELRACLRLVGTRPLKLIADALQTHLNEAPWEQPGWSFHSEGGDLQKKSLLVLPGDQFQLSVGNERSRQDFHRHEGVLEGYISDFAIEVTYQGEDGARHTLSVGSGIVLVPPGVAHQVRLHGLTFVVQVALWGGRVNGDKLVISEQQLAEEPVPAEVG